MQEFLCTRFRFRKLKSSNNNQFEKRIEFYEFKQFIDSKKSFLKKISFTNFSKLDDQNEIVKTKQRSSIQIQTSMSKKFPTRKRLNFEFL